MKILMPMVTFFAVQVGSKFVDHLQSDDILWENFKIEHEKNYEFAEDEVRKTAFLENFRLIQEHNLKHEKGEVSYRAKINKYSDVPREEASRQLSGCLRRTQNITKGEVYFHEQTGDIPDSVDWREQGAVTEVKDQGHCGSCWAFATVGGLESMNFLKTGELVSLSEQNLVDCDYEDSGCQGGHPVRAYEYIKENNGIDTEASYPYTGEDGECKYNRQNKGATVTKYRRIPFGDEEQLKIAVATKGPVVVGINMNDKLQTYGDGVFADPECDPDHLNHSVLVVGYGTSGNGEDYWLIKNSYGTSYGMDGYIMVARNKGNVCGVATDAIYPIV